MLSPNENCFANISQDFLVCTTIHKARQLGVFQGETFVRVTLDKMTRQTKVFANSENPYFNEYFVFEIKCTLGELLRLTILYEVKRRTTCKRNPTLGELLIDMQSVWYQRNRCYFKKWGRLEATIEQQTLGEDVNDSRGYLQIDLAIVSQATNTQTLLSPYRGETEEKDESKSMANVWQINHDYDDIEKNLLENINSDIRCNIRYTLVFYRGVMAKKSDYLIQFRFHPFRGKTLVAKNTQHPVWNQEIQFAWIYPSLAQTCLIQLLSHEHFQWKCVAEHEVHFEEIAFNDKPSLGPTFIHLYDNLNPTKYVGRVLLEILSDCLETLPKRQLYVKAITALDETRYWQEETFVVEFLSLQGDFIHGNISNLKIQIKFAVCSFLEHISNNLECLLKTYPTQKHDTIAKSLKYFRQEAPYKAIALRVSLPDHSHKYEIERFLGEIGEFIKQQLANFQQFRLLLKGGHVQVQQKVFRDIISGIMNEVKNALTTHRLEYRGPKEPTQWDIKRLLHMQDNLVKFWDELNDLRSCLKSANVRTIDDVLQDLIRMVHKLQALGTRNRVQDEWPDLILVVSAGNKDIGYCRLNAKSFQYLGTGSQECPTDQCGRIRNFIFKDTQCQHTCPNCGCIVAIVLGSLSIVIEREYTDFLNKIKSQWLNPEPFYWRPISKATNTAFKCRIFIHQAKVRPGADRSGLCDPYVRVMIASHSAETPVLYATLSPIWNSVISMDCVTLPGSIQWYDAYNAPLVAIELYDTDRRTADDYLGCGTLAIAVISLEAQSLYEDNAPTAEKGIDAQNAWETFKALPNLSPPPLKWVPIALNGVTKAEVLMSAEMVELVLDDNKMVKVMTEPQVSEGIPAAIKPVMKNYVEHILEISLFNRHSLRDEAIGSTYIDLEDRWRSQHRATVGIAQEFSSCGYNKWRDSRKPKEILEEICHRNGVKMPRFDDDVIEIDGMAIEDETEIATEEDLHQRLSLTALKRLQDLPSFGYKLVPEHVETRSLYRTECPGIEQSTFPLLFLSSSLHEKSNQNSQKGKIQLWLELYEGNNINLPPVIDITPQPPELYELRLVIFGVSDVLLDERNIFGTAMSDIYVKGWCSNPDAAQTTDIHYRSLDGEGKFNWRMVFPFKYSSIEDMMVVKRRAGLMDEYQSKQPPILFLQIWDDDIISQDDFLGSLEINLSNFPQPFETAKKCQLTPHENLMSSLLAHGPQMSRRPANVSNNNNNYSPVKLMNIFRQKKVRGWFPVRGHIPEMGNKIGLAGKIELELEVVTEKEASLYPVGLGRNPPNALPEPSRPTSSFNPFTSPWKGFKQIVAPSLWKYLLIIGLLVLLGFAIFLFKKMKTSKNLCIPIRLINLKVKL
ncbi:otoferlin isoform X6 [Stomoxys calcitrans]|uniref:otoferlin isoform X6 n=1 Tax=Stomoxys calcitrans TaxID=35570 RepID=UPI0027E2B93A|nr:otoferlin isoform X6 [Stomoxys calcitrans]